MEKFRDELENIIKETQGLLLENKTEWEPRYRGYAQALHTNEDSITLNRRKFYEFAPFRYYISTSTAKASKHNLKLDVRYRGQSVATMETTQNDVTISTEGKNQNNLDHFGCDIELNNAEWRGKEAKEFRSFFKNRDNSRNSTIKSNEEHYVESLLLSEFSKEGGINKQIRGIQPVKLCGVRFGMPTPLKACYQHKPAGYAKQYGGGIDILARTGGGRYDTHLTVIEVKDENKIGEPPKAALKQAIKYAVFIRELLRSDCGADWYNLFGFNGEIPNQLKIRVVCAMPDDVVDDSFANMTMPIGYDIIECHYIYFKYDGQQLSDFQTSLNK